MKFGLDTVSSLLSCHSGCISCFAPQVSRYDEVRFNGRNNRSTSLQTRPLLNDDTQLHYPLFKSPAITERMEELIVWPMRVLSTFSVPMLEPVKENGGVFHVYSKDRCKSKNRYMEQVEYNAHFIRKMDKHVDPCSFCDE